MKHAIFDYEIQTRAAFSGLLRCARRSAQKEFVILFKLCEYNRVTAKRETALKGGLPAAFSLHEMGNSGIPAAPAAMLYLGKHTTTVPSSRT